MGLENTTIQQAVVTHRETPDRNQTMGRIALFLPNGQGVDMAQLYELLTTMNTQIADLQSRVTVLED